jgi:hypothetical protein
MSKKDYIALAAALRSCKPRPLEENDILLGKTLAWEQCCIAVADACSNLASRFDRAQFLAACQAD